MVKSIINRNIEYYKCEECGLYYKDRTTAKKCEVWCKKHKSCNLEIIGHSVKL